MAKGKHHDEVAEEQAAPIPAVASAQEWIKCKVNVPNCHVGEILCQIPSDTPEADKRLAAIVAAAKVRGIAISASGVPQFASAPEVEFLES